MTMTPLHGSIPVFAHQNRDRSDEFKFLAAGCLKKNSNIDHESSTKSVSFHSIQILEFRPTLGDNPSVRTGPPLTISLIPQRIDTIDVDLYELFRNRRRDKESIWLSTRDRTETLLSEGYTEEDILSAIAEVDRIKFQRYISARYDPEALLRSDEERIILLEEAAVRNVVDNEARPSSTMLASY